MRYSWMQIMCTLYILSSLSAIIILSVALGQCNKKCPGDGYCSCHGVQYDGSEGDPHSPVFPGTFCTDRKQVRKAYNEGRVWPGV
jgi:hypothetical protein